MLVSVILPTYNRANVVSRAICSVLNQSYGNLELLVVDDGSTDGTRKAVEQVADFRVKYIVHPRNRGVAAARNTAIHQARGELIAFLDSDDTWEQEKLELQVEYLRAHSTVAGVISDAYCLDDTDKCVSLMRRTYVFWRMLPEGTCPSGITLDQRRMYLCLLEEDPVKMPTLVVRRKAMENAGVFDETRLAGEDWEFLIRFARDNEFGYIDRPLAGIAAMEDATHLRHLEADKRGMWSTLRRERRRLRGDSEGRAAVRRGIALISVRLGWHYSGIGCRKDAAMVLLKGFCETGKAELLVRVPLALLPSGFSNFLKRAAKGRSMASRPGRRGESRDGA